MLIALLFQIVLTTSDKPLVCSLEVKIAPEATLKIEGKALALEVLSSSAKLQKCESIANGGFYLLEVALGNSGTTSERTETKMFLIKNDKDKLLNQYEQTISYQTTRIEKGEEKVSAKKFPYQVKTKNKRVVVTNLATKERKEFPF